MIAMAQIARKRQKTGVLYVGSGNGTADTDNTVTHIQKAQGDRFADPRTCTGNDSCQFRHRITLRLLFVWRTGGFGCRFGFAVLMGRCCDVFDGKFSYAAQCLFVYGLFS